MSRVGEIAGLAAALAADLSEGSYKAGRQTVLLNADTGAPYDVNMTAYDQGIRNGTQLILI